MIKIDVDTRYWKIPKEEVFLGVESDDKVKTLQFELSKNEFYEGLNFTDCNCYINYKNEDNDAIPYGITDMAVQDDGKVTFTWEVSRGATIFQGNTFAVLCVKKVREDGTITNEWNSRIGAFIVNKGIEPKDSIAELPEIDIISQLLNTAQYVNQIAQENISKSEENIAKSEELIQTAQELLEQNDFYKGYIVDGETYSGKASNSGIKLHKVVGKTSQQTTNGYQLFDTSKVTNKYGLTVTHEADGSFTLNGKTTDTYESYIINVYGSTDIAITSGLKLKANVTNTNIRVIVGNGKNKLADLPLSTNEQSFNVSDIAWVVFRIYRGTSVSNLNLKPMLYQDGDGTWEPFTGGKPAPDPDYPMPIENVEIKNVYSYIGNMFDIDRTFNGDQSCKATRLSSNTIKSEVVAVGSYQRAVYVMNKDEVNFLRGKILKVRWSVEEKSGSINECVQFVAYAQSGDVYINYQGRVPEDTTRMLVGLYVNNSPQTAPIGSYVIFKDVRAIVGDTENTEWTPYGFSNVQTSLTLAKDDIYQQGTITRVRKQVVLDGSSDEGWKNLVANTRVQCQLDTVIRANYAINVNGYCNRAAYRKTGNTNELKNNEFTIVSHKDWDGTRLIIRIPSDISTLEEWKTWLSTHNLIVEYELATPTTEEYKVPTIPSYYPFTNVSTDNDLTTEMQWKILADSDRSLEVEEIQARLAVLEGK